jgi:Ran-binding protein 1
LEEVEVRSGEEDENVLYSARSKLFVYGETMLDRGTGIKSWIERGVGDVRMLQHRNSGHIRLLMRQEKTLKIIANHQIDPRIELTPNIGNDRSWVWQAYDFADGVELVETMFAIRFKDSDIAQAFQTEFVKNQEENRKVYEGIDTEDTTAGDALAEAFVGIATTDTQNA